MLLSHDKNNYINEIKSERRIFPKGKFHTSCTQRHKNIGHKDTNLCLFNPIGAFLSNLHSGGGGEPA